MSKRARIVPGVKMDQVSVIIGISRDVGEATCQVSRRASQKPQRVAA